MVWFIAIVIAVCFIFFNIGEYKNIKTNIKIENSTFEEKTQKLNTELRKNSGLSEKVENPIEKVENPIKKIETKQTKIRLNSAGNEVDENGNLK
jgi:hypothetical protein